MQSQPTGAPIAALSCTEYYNQLPAQAQSDLVFPSYPSFAEIGAAPDIIIAETKSLPAPRSELTARVMREFEISDPNQQLRLIRAEVCGTCPLYVDSIEKAARYAFRRSALGMREAPIKRV